MDIKWNGPSRLQLEKTIRAGALAPSSKVHVSYGSQHLNVYFAGLTSLPPLMMTHSFPFSLHSLTHAASTCHSLLGSYKLKQQIIIIIFLSVFDCVQLLYPLEANHENEFNIFDWLNVRFWFDYFSYIAE